MKALNNLANKLKLPPAMLLFFIAVAAMTLLSIAYTLIATYILKLP